MDKGQLEMEGESKSSQNIIFVHADLDLYGLDPYQFRLYAHIGRRGQCFSSLETISKICKISVRKAQQALKQLEDMGLIKKTTRKKGKTHIYELTQREQWQKSEYNDKDGTVEAERQKVRTALQADLKNGQPEKSPEDF
jgi:predicted transcriptional regulator